MNLGLEGKVALVAAASRGLGRAVAEELAAEGTSLLLCARNAEALDRTCNEISGSTGREVMGVVCDVSSPESVRKMVSEGIGRFGRIDILVTNAGGPPAGRFEDLGHEAWVDAVRLTLGSVLELTRSVLPGMKKQKWGRILNITSIAVKQPVDNLILSNSLRAAVTGFAKTLASELGNSGITVNNILPGFTKTERVEELARALAARNDSTNTALYTKWESEIPMRRLGEPREFAALAAFLVSERASYITGTSIPVDGGWTRGLL
jgi:3-oxoacyl-[acyl-carrier protein] reductase